MRHTRWHCIALFAVLGSVLATSASADKGGRVALTPNDGVKTRTGRNTYGVGTLNGVQMRIYTNKNTATTGRVTLRETKGTRAAAHDQGLVLTKSHDRVIKTKEGGTRTVKVSASLHNARDPNKARDPSAVHGNKRVSITPNAKPVAASKLRAAGIEVSRGEGGQLIFKKVEGKFNQAEARKLGVEWVQGVKGKNLERGYFRSLAAPRSTASVLAEGL